MSDNIDTMTHPSAYRDAVNEKCSQKVDNEIKCPMTQAEKDKSEDWDLYPQMIRKVENEGTAKEVEHLHELEHTTCNK